METTNQPQNSAQQVINSAQQAIQKTGQSIGQTASNVTSQVQSSLAQFSNPSQVMTTSQEFLNSNSLVAKVAITLLVLILFIFFLFLGLNILGYMNQGSANPYVVPGMIYGSNSLSISGQKVQRSNNQPNGMEYTWSVWLQINDVPGKTMQYQHIFNKGNGNYDQKPVYDGNGNLLYSMGSGLATVNNAPGLYLAQSPNSNTEVMLHVVMDNIDPNLEPITIDVTDIPMNKKWVHVAVRLENTVLDVYVNGTISARVAMTSVPKQNYGDIYVCQNGGFSGFLSNLQYYQRALSAYEINQIVQTGPSTKSSNLANMTNGSPYYLSSLWYYSKVGV